MKPKLITLYIFIAFIALTGFTCEETEPLVQAPVAEELTAGEGLNIGAQAPAFSLLDADGNAYTLADSLDKKVVLVFYRFGT